MKGSLMQSVFFLIAACTPLYAAESHSYELEDLSQVQFNACVRELEQYLFTIDLSNAVDSEDLLNITIAKIDSNPPLNFPLLCAFMKKNRNPIKCECQTILNRTLAEFIDQKSKRYYQDLLSFTSDAEQLLTEDSLI